MDLYSFVLAGLAFLGLVVGDAVLFGTGVNVQINVPAPMAQAGFPSVIAETVFAASAQQLEEANSILPLADLDINSRPSVLAAIGKPFNLDQVVSALQRRIGFDTTSIIGTIRNDPAGKALIMTLVISPPNVKPVILELRQEDGEPVPLLKHAAERTVEELVPFRLVLYYLARGMRGDKTALERARALIESAVQQPFNPAKIMQHALLHNAQAVLAMYDDRPDLAAEILDGASRIPNLPRVGRYFISYNQACVALALKRPHAARAFADRSDIGRLDIYPATVSESVHLLFGLVAWAQNDLADAEQHFRTAIEAYPLDATGYTYLAKLLESQGRVEEANAERQKSLTQDAADRPAPFAALMPSLFWLNPEKGGYTHRY